MLGEVGLPEALMLGVIAAFVIGNRLLRVFGPTLRRKLDAP